MLHVEPVAYQAAAAAGSKGTPRLAGAAAGARLSSEAGDGAPIITVGKLTDLMLIEPILY